MDEPLSNLDAKLRVQMRAELKRFHQELGATVVYVTHDQMEAVTMADRIAVMNGGLLQQYDTPEEIYERPVNAFVAGFIGSSSMNLLSGTLVRENGTAAIQGDSGWRHPLSPPNARRAEAAGGGQLVLGVRHNHVALLREARPDTLPAKIYTVEPTGDLTYVHVRLGEQLVVASAPADFRAAYDEPIWLAFDQAHLHLFDAATQIALPAVGEGSIDRRQEELVRA